MIYPFVSERVMGKMKFKHKHILLYCPPEQEKNVSKKRDLRLKSDLRPLDEVGESAKELTLGQW